MNFETDFIHLDEDAKPICPVCRKTTYEEVRSNTVLYGYTYICESCGFAHTFPCMPMFVSGIVKEEELK